MRCALLFLALAPLCGGCFALDWERERSYRGPTVAQLEPILPGRVDLDACLASLGAPLFVHEYGTGAVLGYGERRSLQWQFTVDIPVGERGVSVSYASTHARLDGWLLFFDADWRLAGLRRGDLNDFFGELGRRPPRLLLPDGGRDDE